MKKLFCLGSAIIVTSALFSGESKEVVPSVQLNGDALRMSGNDIALHTSSSAIAIHGTKKCSKKSPSSSGSGNSSGSSPTGAEGLFPGQPGLGNRHHDLAPLYVMDNECWFKGK